MLLFPLVQLACSAPEEVVDKPGDTGCATGCDAADADADADTDTDTDGDSDPGADTGPDTGVPDADGDGFDRGADCDDGDASVNPDATEVCNGEDDDCDAATDDDDTGVIGATTWYEDGDRDGFGDDAASTVACDKPVGFVATAGDCDDADGATHPSASEVCGDAADNDCDGTANGCGITDLTLGSGTVEAMFVGEAAGDSAGATVALVGDIDADGFDDIAIGSPDADTLDTNSGQAYVVRGATSGTVDLGGADFAPEWRYDDMYMATALAPVGDWDGDGFDDLFIGTSFPSGLVFAWAGGAAPADDIDTAFGDDSDSSCYCGSALGSGGDVTGDGEPDLAVGCWGWSDAASDSGRVAIVTSAKFAFGTIGVELADIDAATRTGVAASAYAGKAVAIADDTNGDGIEELLIGAPGAATVYVEYGPVSGSSGVTGTDAVDVGAPGSEYGGAVSGAGDVDADGYGDVVLGASGADGGKVFTGGPAGAMNHGAYAFVGGDLTGSSVGAAGDLDSDGYAELLIGAPGYASGGTSYGATYLFYGPLTGAIDLDLDAVVLRGGSAGDTAGTSVAGGGDVNGDGALDILLGAPDQDDGGSAAGAAYLISGGGW